MSLTSIKLSKEAKYRSLYNVSFFIKIKKAKLIDGNRYQNHPSFRERTVMGGGWIPRS